MDQITTDLLNDNINDVKPIINDYYKTFPLFIIGIHSYNYDGYRLVTTKDVNNGNFRKLFENSYRMNNGILSLDTFEGDVLCIDKYTVKLNGEYGENWLRTADVVEAITIFGGNAFTKEMGKMEKNKIIQLRTVKYDHDYILENIGKITVCECEQCNGFKYPVGFFVLENHQF